jgi:FAD/FMN-containing dehydrogenase
MVGVVAAWDAADRANAAKHRQWAQDVSNKLTPFALPGGYPNLLGPEEYAQITAAYGYNIDRLREVKRQFDPDSVFTATPLPA